MTSEQSHVLPLMSLNNRAVTAHDGDVESVIWHKVQAIRLLLVRVPSLLNPHSGLTTV